MTSRTAVKLLLILVLALPILQVVFTWVGGLLSAMGDGATAGMLEHLGTAVRLIWLVSIVGLIVMLAVQSLEEPREE